MIILCILSYFCLYDLLYLGYIYYCLSKEIRHNNLKIIYNSLYSVGIFIFLIMCMKKFVLFIFAVVYLLPLFIFAQSDSRGEYGTDPIRILDRVKDEANDDFQIQQTSLDDATDME